MTSAVHYEASTLRAVRYARLGFAVALAVTVFAPSVRAQSFIVQYSFAGGTDGATPSAALILDAGGNLYGTTTAGGIANLGTAFQVAPDFSGGTESLLYSFLGGADGATPEAALVPDPAGNLYGTTSQGGASNLGTVFKLDTNGTKSILHDFTGGADGAVPQAGLVLDAAGNLYGTTGAGGASLGGTVFKVDTNGTETVLHTFTGGPDGGGPIGDLILDAAGNLYGTANYGGIPGGCVFNVGCGVVFKLDANGNETVLHTFTGMPDGAFPSAGLILDAAGNLYGTTAEGGTSDSGTVFEVDPASTETVLFSFSTGGLEPTSGLVLDAAGNLYGTTSNGASGFGTVFELSPAGTETELYTFTGGTDGGSPAAGLVLDAAGNLYGTTTTGGAANFGTVFEISPDFSLAVSALTPGTVSAGGSATSTVNINGLSAFNGAVTLSCSVAPSGASSPKCSISPGSIGVGIPATLTVTASGARASNFPAGSGLFYALGLPLIGIVAGVGFSSDRKGKGKIWVLTCLLFAGLGFAVACGGSSAGGGGGGNNSYSITVSGKSGLLEHSTTTSLMVQ